MKKEFCRLDFAKIAALAKAANDKEACDVATNEYFKVMSVTLKKRQRLYDEDVQLLKPYIDRLDDYDWDEWEKKFASQRLQEINKCLENPMSLSDMLKLYL
jgi:hypothetical protein